MLKVRLNYLIKLASCTYIKKQKKTQQLKNNIQLYSKKSRLHHWCTFKKKVKKKFRQTTLQVNGVGKL